LHRDVAAQKKPRMKKLLFIAMFWLLAPKGYAQEKTKFEYISTILVMEYPDGKKDRSSIDSKITIDIELKYISIKIKGLSEYVYKINDTHRKDDFVISYYLSGDEYLALSFFHYKDKRNILLTPIDGKKDAYLSFYNVKLLNIE
jgi:hypothetical protein